MVLTNDTIAAIATPPGKGGVGIIKISGPLSRTIATKIFRPRSAVSFLKSYHLCYGEVVDPRQGDAIDEALLSFMAQPSSHTGEDVVEISSHGGYLVLQEILRLVLEAGARIAEQGEFTKRALLNGRIDLAQAEAVIDLIETDSPLGLKQATAQLKGVLSREVNGIREELVELLSLLEASIDFPEEDLELTALSPLVAQVETTISRVKALHNSYAEGKLYRQGATTIIAGKPNVGKSSLFNCLLSEDRSIVAAAAGTTRDFIEEVIVVKGITLRLVDTAGLREPSDSIEAEGVRRSHEKLAQADLVFLVIDGSAELDQFDHETSRLLRGKRVVVACNKSDLPRKASHDTLKSWFPGCPVVCISALHNTGVKDLKNTALSLLPINAHAIPASAQISNLRHKHTLAKALECLDRARQAMQDNLPQEFVSTDIQAALCSLGEITGHTTTEEVLEQIFGRFCIGK
jgi:tRNA modification GTPase